MPWEWSYACKLWPGLSCCLAFAQSNLQSFAVVQLISREISVVDEAQSVPSLIFATCSVAWCPDLDHPVERGLVTMGPLKDMTVINCR